MIDLLEGREIEIEEKKRPDNIIKMKGGKIIEIPEDS